ncbi:DUF2600 family protein [Niallia taxi]|nr:DUF2600 family protein [Niallia taxi]MDE5052367.1 DUF2600 family protein [Niallia taxi]
MSEPNMPLTLVSKVNLKVFPVVHKELNYWTNRATQIPNPELRKQALASIKDKTFQCEAGSVMALISRHEYKVPIKFIVAYQTVSDYLDSHCDRSTSLDPRDFSALHESKEHALTVGAEASNYYRYREDQDEGGYLKELAKTCRDTLAELGNYEHIKDHLLELCSYYCDLQIHKHVYVEERIPRLQSWFNGNKHAIPEMEWYEFSACSGSTLGIFCLVSYALRKDFEPSYSSNIREGYFPYIQGLHILVGLFYRSGRRQARWRFKFLLLLQGRNRAFQSLEAFCSRS